jgi:hypothetical protein
MNIMLRLPQTTLRLIGLPSIRESNVFQVESQRYNSMNDFEKSLLEKNYSEFNQIALAGIVKSFQKLQTIDLYETKIKVEPTLFDSNLIDHLPREVFRDFNIEVIDYASSLYSPTWPDIVTNTRGFLRSLKRSLILSRKAEIKVFWDWTTIHYVNEARFVKPWFWESKSLSQSQFEDNLKILIQNCQNASSQFNDFISSKVRLAIITDHWLPKDQKKILDHLFFNNPRFHKHVLENIPIYIKGRRENATRSPNKILESYRGCQLIHPQSVNDFFVPAELYYLATRQESEDIVFSELGSSVLNGLATNVQPIEHDKDEFFIKQSGYLIQRMSKDLPNFPW